MTKELGGKFGEAITGTCGPASLCTVISQALGRKYTPENLFKDFPYIINYHTNGSGYADSFMKDGRLLNDVNSKYGINLKFEDNYYYGKAWGEKGHLEEGNLVEALKDGKVAIWRTSDERFTTTGHYMTVNLTEDGKLWITDSNSKNWYVSDLQDGYKNGFSLEEIARCGGCFYIFSNDSTKTVTTTTTKTIKNDDDTIANEILQKALEKAKGGSTNAGKKKGKDIKSETENNDEKVPEIPLYNQKDYADVPYCVNGNLAEDGCGIVTYSMLLSYLFDDEQDYTPEILAKKYEGTYGGAWGTSYKMFDETPKSYGLEVEKCYAWEGWVKEDKIVNALKNNQPVVAYVGKKSGLTGSGHYVLLTGITEDGKILVNDPNGDNYQKSSLQDGFDNGFDIKTFSKDTESGYWIFPSKKDVLKNAAGNQPAKETEKDTKPATSKKPTTSTSPTQSDDTTTNIKPKWESDYLTAPKGYIKYKGEDGRLTKETWCDLNPKQLGINMNNRRN